MSEVQGAVNPATQIHEAIKLCRRPFTAAAIKWKIQTNPKDTDAKKRAAVVAFIDARLAGERLNAAGLPWSSKFTIVPGGLLCSITVRNEIGDTLIERSDVGWSKDYDKARDAEKGMVLKTGYSDALKRAAVHFGVGVSIYALPIKYLSGADDEITQRGNNWYITDKGKRALAKHYDAWLEKIGVPQFGEPIDHGDVDGAQGDLESTDRENDGDVTSAPAGAAPKTESKPEPTPAPAPVEVKPVSKVQVDKILDALAQSTKKVADVQTFLASKGVEGFDPEGTLEQLVELKVDFEIGKALYVWLHRAKAPAV